MNMATGISFEEFRENGAYYKGLLHTPSGVMYGLYSKEKEEILPPRYAAIDNDPVESKCFFIKDSWRGRTIIFIDKPRSYIKCDFLYDSLRLEHVTYLYPEVDCTEYTLIAQKDDSQLVGSILIGNDGVLLQVPAKYKKLVRGKAYIAAYDFDGSICIYRSYWNQKDIDINLPLAISGTIQNLAFGYNEPYPIVDGKVCIPETNLTFDSVAPVGKYNPYCIVQINGRYGLWKEASLEGPGDLLLKCEYDSLIPNEETYPFSNDFSKIHSFSFEKNFMWGIYSDSRGIISTAIFPIKPITVCGICEQEDGGLGTYIEGYICSLNGKQGVISNRSGHEIIPFEYDEIVAAGYREDVIFTHTKLFYKAYQGAECKLFDREGKDILEASYSSIDIIHLLIVTTPGYSEPDSCFFICEKDGLYGLMDEKGNEILPFNFATLGYNKERGVFVVKKSAGSEFEEMKLFDNPPSLSIAQLFELG